MATTARTGGFGPSTAHYNVVRVLGEGGFGKVWECVDVRSGGRWAVKESKEVGGVCVSLCVENRCDKVRHTHLDRRNMASVQTPTSVYTLMRRVLRQASLPWHNHLICLVDITSTFFQCLRTVKKRMNCDDGICTQRLMQSFVAACYHRRHLQNIHAHVHASRLSLTNNRCVLHT